MSNGESISSARDMLNACEFEFDCAARGECFVGAMTAAVTETSFQASLADDLEPDPSLEAKADLIDAQRELLGRCGVNRCVGFSKSLH